MVNHFKGLLGFVGVALGLALVVMGCSPSAKPTPGAPVLEEKKEPQQGGKLTIGGGVSGTGLHDPHKTAVGTRNIVIPIGSKLFTRDIYDPQYPIVPDLVKSWEVSKDGLTYTFKLHEGVKFQALPPVNGREVTAEDARYSISRMAADPTLIPKELQPRFERKAEFTSIKNMEAPDKHTLAIHLKEPYAPLLDALSNPGSVILPRELVEEQGGTIKDRHIGTGPFIWTEYRPEQIVHYKRNPDYWKKGLPYLDELTIVQFSDLQAQLASFRAGQIDMPDYSALTTPAVDAITKAFPEYKVKVYPISNIWTWRFNVAKFTPFQDVRVRRAIHLVIDRQQSLDVLGEGLGVVSATVTPFHKDMANSMDWLLSQPGYRQAKDQDIAEAKGLMEKAGYKDGFTMKALISSGGNSGDFAALLIDQLKVLKITLKVQTEEYGVWVSRSVQGDFDINLMTHRMAADVDSTLSTHLHSRGARNYGKFSDQVLEELIEKQRRTIDFEERRKIVWEAEKRILELAPWVHLYARAQPMVTPPWVHNISAGFDTGEFYYSMEKAWIEKKR